jgi:hypothetical protein
MYAPVAILIHVLENLSWGGTAIVPPPPLRFHAYERKHLLNIRQKIKTMKTKQELAPNFFALKPQSISSFHFVRLVRPVLRVRASPLRLSQT